MCRLYRILYGLVPLVPMRGWLLQKHLADCPSCSQSLDPQTTRSVAQIPAWIRQQDSLWPQVKAGILVPRSEPHTGRVRSEPQRLLHWRAAVAALSLAVLIASNLLILRNLDGPTTAEIAAGAADHVTVNFAEVKGKQARHHIYQTPSTSYIWFIQSKDSGGE